MSNRMKFKNQKDGVAFFTAVKQFIRTSKKIEKLHDMPYSERTINITNFKSDLVYHESVKETAIALIAEAVSKATQVTEGENKE